MLSVILKKKRSVYDWMTNTNYIPGTYQNDYKLNGYTYRIADH